MKYKSLKQKILSVVVSGLAGIMSTAYCLPNQGAYDNSAAATISSSTDTMTILGKGRNNILNWQTFSIYKGETVKFMDKNNYLNLVNGFDLSVINGTVSGGGIIYLINPYGILFGQGATLNNVGSFVASTRDLSDIDKNAFLTDPENTQNVLYGDSHASRDKDYIPSDSPYRPTISVADIKLTNTPASATKIVLDGPDGVILQSEDVLDKLTNVSTKKTGGEIGIGSNNGTLALTQKNKDKIFLTSGANRQ